MTGGGNVKSLKLTLENEVILGNETLEMAEMSVVKIIENEDVKEIRGQNIRSTFHVYCDMAVERKTVILVKSIQ